MAGQTVGEGIIIDCSRYHNKICEILLEGNGTQSSEEAWAVVESGAILRDINNEVVPIGYIFGPDPSTVDRATIGRTLSRDPERSAGIWGGSDR